MADWAKIALKTALIVGVMAGIWAVFALVQIPVIDFSIITQNAGKALAILTYFCPVFPTIWTVVLSLAGLLVALWTFRFASVAIRWLFKVNE